MDGASRQGNLPGAVSDAELDEIVHSNPKPQKASPEDPLLDLPTPSFYDKHLGSKDVLKNVVVVPSLHTDIQNVFLRRWEDVRRTNSPLPPTDSYMGLPTASFKPRHTQGDAWSIGRNYIERTGEVAQTLASTVLLHSKASCWTTVLSWAEGSPEHSSSSSGFNEDYAPALNLELATVVNTGILSVIEGSTLLALQQAEKIFPRLAVWHSFAITPQAVQILREMGDYASSDASPWLTDPLDGYTPTNPAPSHPRKSVDSSFAFLDDFPPHPALLQDGQPSRDIALRRSERIKSRAKAPTEPRRPPTRAGRRRLGPTRAINKTQTPGPATINLRSTESSIPPGQARAADWVSVIQHAWNRAVEYDSTFIVFHVGNYERIAIRHRATQKLFLSKVIDVTAEEDGPYTALHAGLYTAILLDVLARVPHYLQPELNGHLHGRASARTGTIRRWTRAAATEEAKEESVMKRLFIEAENRFLLLITLNYGIFDSPRPSMFIRTEKQDLLKKSFKSSEYSTIALTSFIGTGAVGQVHEGRLSLVDTSGHLLSCKVVVKFAFDPEQRKKIRREIQIYDHLVARKTSGIPRLFGLFQDPDTRALAMVMQDVGTSVKRTHWFLQPSGQQEGEFTDQEADAFIDSLQSIHGTGVRHRDIRPENMTLTRGGNAYFIDFDRAVLQASEKSRAKEMDQLLDLLDGHYVPPDVRDSATRHPLSWVTPSGPSSSPE